MALNLEKYLNSTKRRVAVVLIVLGVVILALLFGNPVSYPIIDPSPKWYFIWYILTITPIILLTLGYIFPSTFFSSQESIRTFVNSWGIFAPIAFIFLQIVQVILTPLSHYTVSVAGGFIFGTWQGFIYNWCVCFEFNRIQS